MSSVHSATSAAHRVPSHAGANPRAAGPPVHFGGAVPDSQQCHHPKGSLAHTPHSSYWGCARGLALGVLCYHCATAPSALPRGRRVRKRQPVRSTRPTWLETALFTATGCKLPHSVAEWVAGNPGYRTLGRILYFRYSSQGCVGVTLYGYARVSVREPEDKNLDLQVERLVRAGCSMGNIRAEEASGAKDDRGGLLELLDLVVEGDTLVVTHIDRLSRGLTYGLQVIEGLHHAGVEFQSLAEDFDT